MAEEHMKKSFKCSLNGKVAIDLTVEGSPELVTLFTEETLDSFGAFYKLKDTMSELFINGVKHHLLLVQRDPKGHFVKKKS